MCKLRRRLIVCMLCCTGALVVLCLAYNHIATTVYYVMLCCGQCQLSDFLDAPTETARWRAAELFTRQSKGKNQLLGLYLQQTLDRVLKKHHIELHYAYGDCPIEWGLVWCKSEEIRYVMKTSGGLVIDDSIKDIDYLMLDRLTCLLLFSMGECFVMSAQSFAFKFDRIAEQGLADAGIPVNVSKWPYGELGCYFCSNLSETKLCP